ncbi:MAG: radical SAM protein [Candidatus Krumholzibacteriota bacterium]|nr:radical SAM protein [Candidatus Krumholzibacteriota bacterium]
MKSASLHWSNSVLKLDSPMPFNYTLSVTNRCNSRCKTCNIWAKDSDRELDIDEWLKIINSIGESARWITFSGGEPSLYEDLSELIGASVKRCKASVINMPTNGLLPEKIVLCVEKCNKYFRSSASQMMVNVSIDGLEELNDDIRGRPDAYVLALETIRRLQELKYPWLKTSVHSVISKYNIKYLEQLIQQIAQLKIDGHIFEIAEKRKELDTLGTSLLPDNYSLKEIISRIKPEYDRDGKNMLLMFRSVVREEYYKHLNRWLDSENMNNRCLAGRASVQICPNGDVWNCCIQGDKMANIADHDYDFNKLWNSEAARMKQRSYLRKDCACPLVNVFYSNLLCDPVQYSKVVIKTLYYLMRR